MQRRDCTTEEEAQGEHSPAAKCGRALVTEKAEVPPAAPQFSVARLGLENPIPLTADRAEGPGQGPS